MTPNWNTTEQSNANHRERNYPCLSSRASKHAPGGLGIERGEKKLQERTKRIEDQPRANLPLLSFFPSWGSTGRTMTS